MKSLSPKVAHSDIAFREEERDGHRHVHASHVAHDGHTLTVSARFRSTLDEATELAVSEFKRIHGADSKVTTETYEQDGDTFVIATDGLHRVLNVVQTRKHVEHVLTHAINHEHRLRYPPMPGRIR